MPTFLLASTVEQGGRKCWDVVVDGGVVVASSRAPRLRLPRAKTVEAVYNFLLHTQHSCFKTASDSLVNDGRLRCSLQGGESRQQRPPPSAANKFWSRTATEPQLPSEPSRETVFSGRCNCRVVHR